MLFFQDNVLRHRQQHLAALNQAEFSSREAAKILAYGAPIGAVIECHQQIDRCMSRLQQLMAEAEAKGGALAAGTAVIAGTLSASMGRFDRRWHAPPGGIWLTAAWPDVLLPEFCRLLPFAAGLACCRTVRSYGVFAWLKWVNDVLANGRKIAGILCSTVLSPRKERYHLLGIGLNANNQNFPQELRSTAVSLAGILGYDVDLAELAGKLLAELSWTVGLLHYDEAQALHEGRGCEDGRESLLLTAWRNMSDTIGRHVEYGFDVQKEPLFRAKAVGLAPCGGLIMELADGGQTTEYSGEIVYA